MVKSGVLLVDVPGTIWLSLDEEISTDTKANSSKIFNWKCLNKDHPTKTPKKWRELCRARVQYQWCPECSPRARKGRKCQECDVGATYNYVGEKGGAFCTTHKKKGMANVKDSTCAYPECKKIPAYNLPGALNGVYCNSHKKEGMIDVKSHVCVHPMCKIQPAYNLPGSSKGLYCNSHKKEGMVNVKNHTCSHQGCKIQPIYNLPGNIKGLYCNSHKKEGMVNIKHASCIHSGCKIRPNYNLPGIFKGLYCSSHKKDGMVNVLNSGCVHPGCKILPAYNLPGNVKGLYCSSHKKEGMVNIKSPTCNQTTCKIQPAYNYPGTAKGLYCASHKKESMVNVVSPTCIYPGCKTQPVYNLPGTSRGIYCNSHKKEDMVNIRDSTCDHPGCKTQCNFGFPGNPPTKCVRHLDAGMISNPRKKCTRKLCKEIAVMGTRDTHGEFCEQHAPPSYVSLLKFRCKGCNLPCIVDEEGYCTTCHPETISRFRLAKQNQVVSWLSTDPDTKDFTTVDQLLDQTRNCVDSKRYRPDIAYEREEGYMIIVEIDEHQHTSDSYRKCDVPRMVNLHQDIGAPVYFIRYNPDPYLLKGKEKNPTDNLRKKILTNWIKWVKNYASEGKVTDGLHVIYLFYDDYQEKQEWETIDPFKSYHPKKK